MQNLHKAKYAIILNEGKDMTNKISNEALQEIITNIYNYAYTNSPVRTPTTIGKEVGKMLHIGMYIEEVEGKKPAFSLTSKELNMLNENKEFSIEFATYIKKIYIDMNKKWELYKDDLLFDSQNINYICAKLNNILISDPDKDVFGDSLEVFRSKWIKQEGGQFFTDQKVTTLAMNLLDFDPRKGDTLVDLCSGTGGFLLAGLKHIKSLLESDPNNTEKDIVTYASQSLIGQEIDAEVARVGNATLSSRLGVLNTLLIHNGNSLNDEDLKLNSRIKFGEHTCLATNPPFGAKITIKDNNILEQFDLAKLSNSKPGVIEKKLYRRAPDILFIEKNIKLLRPGVGKLAIILPYQVLSGPQTLYVRHWILKHAKLLAVIDLPSETFQPHTGTKTALVLLERREKPLDDLSNIENEKIFMSLPQWIGHDRRGNPVYKKSEDGKLTNEILSDFNELTNAYKAYINNDDFSLLHKYSFSVYGKDIIADSLLRFNAQFHGSRNNPEKNHKINSTNFRKVKLKNVVKRIFFPGRFKRNYVEKYDQAVPFFGGSNITQLIVNTEKWFHHNDPKLKQLQVREGWILITRSGTTGIVSSVPKSWDGVAMSEHVIRIVPDTKKLDPGYIQAFLKTNYCQKEIAKGVFGSVIDEITPETIGELEILIPNDKKIMEDIISNMNEMEIAKEKAISNLYGTIDKINNLLLSDSML